MSNSEKVITCHNGPSAPSFRKTVDAKELIAMWKELMDEVTDLMLQVSTMGQTPNNLR